MTTELWWGDAHSYMREVMATGHLNFAWSMSASIRYGIDPQRFLKLHCAGLPWRALLIAKEGCIEWSSHRDDPIGVYPIWEYHKHNIADLIDWVENPLGEDPKAINNSRIVPMWRPVAGQPHRVVVSGMPFARSGPAKRLMMILEDLQEAHPECVIHLHRPVTFTVPFGHNIASADLDIKYMNFGSKVYLANGTSIRKGIPIRDGQTKWLHLVGFSAEDIQDHDTRILCSMKGALWAAENFNSLVDFRVTGRNLADPNAVVVAPTTSKPQRIMGHKDKMICDTCTVRNGCKYYREGSVCAVAGSEGEKLTKLFGSRDAARIIDGMAALQAINAERLEAGLANEDEEGKLDSEVTKIIANMMTAAERQAKLIDPRLAASQGHSVAIGIINNGGATTSIQTASPAQLMGQAVQELVAAGTNRDSITQEMIEFHLAQRGHDIKAIEATAS